VSEEFGQLLVHPLSHRQAIQSDVRPGSVNQRVLRADDALFTYNDTTITPVGSRSLTADLVGDVTGNADTATSSTSATNATNAVNVDGIVYLKEKTISNEAYTILDDDGFTVFILTGTLTADRTVTLPTLADNRRRRLIFIDKSTHDTYKWVIDGEGAETIHSLATIESALDSEFIVELYGDAAEWKVVSSVVERGSDYVRFSSGLQICWGAADVATTTLANANIGTYGWSYYQGNTAVTFAKAFATGTVPRVFPAHQESSVGANASANSVTATGCTLGSRHHASVTVEVAYHAIGYWK
jgi:hypothetical protein